MNDDRRRILKKIIFSGACMTAPLVAFGSPTKNSDLFFQAQPKINSLGDGMYEIDGWVIPSSDLRLS